MAVSEMRGKAPETRRARPIVYYLVVLALVAFVPVMAFAAVLLQRNNEAQQEIVQTLILATAEAVGQAVDQQTDGMITTLKGLSSAPVATQDDLRALHDRGQSVLAGTGTFLALIDSNYNILLNTRFPFSPLPVQTENRDAVDRALSSGQIIISDAVYGPMVKAWVMPIFLPVVLPDGRHAAFTITQNADNVGTVLLRRQMPDGWRIALVDTQNHVIAASPGSQVEQGKPFFFDRSPETEGQKGWQPFSVGGRDYVSITATSGDTGWRVVAWAPAAYVERPLSNSLLTLIIGGIVIVAAASISTFFLSREITRSVSGLARDARRLGTGEPVPPRNYPISEIVDVATAIASAAKQRQASETEVRFLMRELAHRSKNQMTVIAAMAKQSARGADSVPEFVQSFEKRIFGLARSTDLLLANGIAGVDLEELLTSQITPFWPLDGEQVEISGPPVRLNNQSAQILGMAAHELATNAAKYGAFFTEDGRLSVVWSKDADGLALNWRERMKVLPPRPERRGFGTTVLENMVGVALGASVKRTLHEDGIEWDFVVPLQSLDPTGPPEGRPAPPRPQPVAPVAPPAGT
jgi:two-component sensor histidine kinase